MDMNDKDDSMNEPNYRGVKAMPFVIGNETFEKLGTIGTTSNLLVYLTSVFHMNTITATNVINIFNGTCNFGTLFGAFLSDTYFGRYATLGFASISSFLGMLLLTLTATISKLRPSPCSKVETDTCNGPTAGQMAFLLSSFGLLVIGASGIRPCNLAFGADQFNPNRESGRRGISSFFTWYYFTYTLAVMVSITVVVYVQSNVSWSLGLAIPTILMFFSCALFFAGSRIYVRVVPQGSPLTSIVQVIVASIKKRRLKLPENPSISLYKYYPANYINSKLPYTNQFSFLSKAAIITVEDQIKVDGSRTNPWRLCSIQQVEEVKCLLRLMPVWIVGAVYYISIVQQQTYVVFQANQSDRSVRNSNFKIPAASYSVFTMVSLTIWLPLYDRLIIPLLRRLTKIEDGITLLQKIGTGIFLSIITMLVSALVEYQRRTLANTKSTLGLEPRQGAISSMSGSWLIAQLVLAGLSEGFALIGQVEFYYKQFPENMRSFAGSFLFCSLAMSSYFSSFLVSTIHHITGKAENGNWLAQDLNKGKLDYFYYLVAALEVINLGGFLMFARWYRYKGTGGNTLEMTTGKSQYDKPMV